MYHRTILQGVPIAQFIIPQKNKNVYAHLFLTDDKAQFLGFDVQINMEKEASTNLYSLVFWNMKCRKGKR
jgi:hypothetical protein